MPGVTLPGRSIAIGRGGLSFVVGTPIPVFPPGRAVPVTLGALTVSVAPVPPPPQDVDPPPLSSTIGLGSLGVAVAAAPPPQDVTLPSLSMTLNVGSPSLAFAPPQDVALPGLAISSGLGAVELDLAPTIPLIVDGLESTIVLGDVSVDLSPAPFVDLPGISVRWQLGIVGLAPGLPTPQLEYVLDRGVLVGALVQANFERLGGVLRYALRADGSVDPLVVQENFEALHMAVPFPYVLDGEGRVEADAVQANFDWLSEN